MACFALLLLLLVCHSASVSLLQHAGHGSEVCGGGADTEVEDDMDDWFEDAAAMDGSLNVTAAYGNARGSAKRLLSKPWCPRSRWIRPSPEDVLAGLEQCSNTHVLFRRVATCHMRFGGYFRNHATGKTFFYEEILKTGTRSMVSALKPYWVQVREPNAVEERDAEGIEAIAFVRHPVSRFLSGYGTVMNRIWREKSTAELAFAFEEEEPQRFNRFVDLFVRHGEAITQWYTRGDCLLQHLFSQTWFLNLWPGKVSLFHTESYVRDFGAVANMTQLPLKLPHGNVNEGNLDRSLLEQQHGALQKLHDYFADEMDALGYKPLPGYSR